MNSATENATDILRSEQATVRMVHFVVGELLTCIVCTAGLLGNSLSVVVLWRSKTLQSVAFTYMRWLAISDFLVILEYTTYLIYRSYSVQRWPWGLLVYQAHFGLYLYDCFASSSCLLISAITVERYFCISHPFRWRKLHNKSTATAVIICAYLLSFVLMIPHTLESHIYLETEFNDSRSYYTYDRCVSVVEHPAYKHGWVWGKEMITHVSPILCLLSLNPLTVRAYRRSVVRKRALQRSAEEKAADKEERRVVILLLSISVVFLTCTVFVSVLSLLWGRLPTDQVRPSWSLSFVLLLDTAYLLEQLNFAANFYAYSLASKDFRLAFRGIFFRCLVNRVNPDHNTSITIGN